MMLILPVCFRMWGECVSGTLNLLWCCWGSYYVGLSCCHSSLNAGDCVLSTITSSLLSWWLSSWSEQTSLFGYRGTPLMLSFYSQPGFGGLSSSHIIPLKSFVLVCFIHYLCETEDKTASRHVWSGPKWPDRAENCPNLCYIAVKMTHISSSFSVWKHPDSDPHEPTQTKCKWWNSIIILCFVQTVYLSLPVVQTVCLCQVVCVSFPSPPLPCCSLSSRYHGNEINMQIPEHIRWGCVIEDANCLSAHWVTHTHTHRCILGRIHTRKRRVRSCVSTPTCSPALFSAPVK